MLTKRPPEPAPMTLNLAPMVDVMMCLIIFFLLASRLATEQFPIQLPWAAEPEVVKPGALGERVTITVRPVAEVDDVAEYLVADWDGRRVANRVLRARDVQGLLAARAERARKSDDTIRCVIRADRNVLYKHVEVVLRACGRAGVEHIVFPVQKGTDPHAEVPG